MLSLHSGATGILYCLLFLFPSSKSSAVWYNCRIVKPFPRPTQNSVLYLSLLLHLQTLLQPPSAVFRLPESPLPWQSHWPLKLAPASNLFPPKFLFPSGARVLLLERIGLSLPWWYRGHSQSSPSFCPFLAPKPLLHPPTPRPKQTLLRELSLVRKQCSRSWRPHWTIAFLRKCHLLARNSHLPRLSSSFKKKFVLQAALSLAHHHAHS